MRYTVAVQVNPHAPGAEEEELWYTTPGRRPEPIRAKELEFWACPHVVPRDKPRANQGDFQA